MTPHHPTALIADDEPLLRDVLEHMLKQVWPALTVVARARNGREAIQQFDAVRPEVCFLDIHMPGLSGIEVAQHIGHRAHVVFVTAHDDYAVQAFTQGALDYLVKPVAPDRLAESVARLQARLQAAQPAVNTDALLAQLLARLQPATAPLRWIHAQVGEQLRLIAVEHVDYLRADTKYTLVAWRDDQGKPAEAWIRTPLKELLAQLDAAQFVQIHRAYIVNRHAIGHVLRGHNETASVHLKHRNETLPVSRTFLQAFKQM